MNLNKFISIARMTTVELFDSLYEYLLKEYPFVYKDDKRNYIFVQGQSSVCLVAHLDTVLKVPPQKFYKSRLHKKVIVGVYGLGADDRAGVYAIMSLIDSGLRPSVIFTTGEEEGGVGAFELIQKYPTCPLKTSCLIELDRCGKNDSVYYNSANKEFEQFINSFGFRTKTGIFSDISILAPAWDIAAVNLSVGYFDEHTHREKLNQDFLDLTIAKVNDIIVSEPKYYDYQEDTDFTLFKACFVCQTGDCENCTISNDFFTKGGKRWPPRDL